MFAGPFPSLSRHRPHFSRSRGSYFRVPFLISMPSQLSESLEQAIFVLANCWAIRVQPAVKKVMLLIFLHPAIFRVVGFSSTVPFLFISFLVLVFLQVPSFHVSLPLLSSFFLVLVVPPVLSFCLFFFSYSFLLSLLFLCFSFQSLFLFFPPLTFSFSDSCSFLFPAFLVFVLVS